MSIGEDAASWKFVDANFYRQTRRLLILADIQRSNFVYLVAEPTEHPQDSTKFENRLAGLLSKGKAKCAHSTMYDNERDRIIQPILALCRTQYGTTLPKFANTLFFSTSEMGLQLTERLDPLLLPALQTANQIFDPALVLPPLVSRFKLSDSIASGESFLPQTRLVHYQGHLHVAKGPTSPKSVLRDFAEIKNTVCLPTRHPNIIRSLIALITVSNVDQRLCGFLIEYYENGILDDYARRLRGQGPLPSELLYY